MDGAQVGSSLFMHEAEFADVVMRSASIGGLLRLSRSKVTGKLDMSGVQVNSFLLMDHAKFADVGLFGAHIVGQLHLDCSKVTGRLGMDALRADQYAFLREAEFAGVVLRGARVGGQLELTKSKVTGNLDMYGVQVGSALLMHEAEFADVVLRGARVGGQLDLARTKVTGKLDMTMLQVDSSLFMANAQFAEVVMRGARVGGQHDLSESKVTGKLIMEVLSVGAALHMSKAELTEVNISSAHVGGELSLLGSKVSETLTMHAVRIDKDLFLGRGSEYHGAIHIVFGKIGGSLELTGGIFHDIVQLTGTQVTGELRLASSKDDLPRWLKESALILRSARADAIQDLKDAWPPKNRLELTGFTYRSLGGVFTPERDSIGGRRVEWFQEWLGRQKEYTAAPYEHLATVLRSHGRAQDAQEILYASREGERADTIQRAREEYSLGAFPESIGSFFQYAWLTILKCLIGYGYHIERTLIWVAVFIFAGFLVLQISGQGRKNGMPVGITYSFDMLLPIIELRKKHYDIDLEGWPRYYFYVHKIMGYVLASFLIAGIAGLTK